MKRYLKVGEAYEQGGEKKMSYKTIGEMFTGKNGKEYAKLYFMPGVLVCIFEDEKKKESETVPEIPF